MVKLYFFLILLHFLTLEKPLYLPLPFLIRTILRSPRDMPEKFRPYGFYPPRISAAFRLNFGGIVFSISGSIFSLAVNEFNAGQ